MKKVLALLFTFAIAVSLLTPVASAAPAAVEAVEQAERHGDDLPDALNDEQRELRQQGLEKVLKGQAQARGNNKVVEVAKGQYVELGREGEDLIWTVLGEFSDLPHNQIPQPDRAVNNTTIWTADFSQQHYDQLLYSDAPGVNSVRNFYKELSSNRYAVGGAVTDWIRVPGAGASYGTTDQQTWLFVRDTVNGWYNQQLAAGKTAAEIDAYLAQFDVWDRNDFDRDGNFDEADGYIDHFQAVHSGQGEEVGGGVLGAAAIWSHRWTVQLVRNGQGGPTLTDGRQVRQGGTQVGQSRFWIRDYTVEPENGGVGVFAHEFGHDLGLPDLYNTAGTCGSACENASAFWTLMSSGSYGSDGTEDIGTRPVHMGAWEKLQLGWLNYETAYAGQKSEHKLGSSAFNTKQAQALVVVLPDKQVPDANGVVRSYFNAYIAEFRQYRGYDASLQAGPYNFGFLNNPALQDKVEHFPYQDGLLISYWDQSQRNNNVSQHPGAGLVLPIDAHPEPLLRADGGVWRNRIQSYDSTFSQEPTDRITLHFNSQPTTHGGLAAAPVFDDTNLYWSEANPYGSVKNPNTGTSIAIQSVSAQDSFMQVQVRPSN
ncbi:MAG TPA: immune inhibitor A domain-containing protein [Herpetosiphonaceae bacterium]